MIFNYYVTGNTAEGFVNFLESNVEGIEKLVILKHASNKFKTMVMKQLIKNYKTTDDIEVLNSPLGNDYLDGMILRDKSIAVIVDSIAANLKGTEINLEPQSKQLDDTHALNEIQKYTQEAYSNFAAGLNVHDKLEAIYINEMNFDRADQLAWEFNVKLLKDYSKRDTSKIKHRLFGTNTADGVVNVVPQILDTLSKNYFIKGRAGTGKSTFMKKIAYACSDHGFDVELYHCSFDPNSIDMVLVRELDFCIFDSTDPHEFFPERDGDEIVDLYKELVTPGTDEKYEKEIAELNSRYKSYMKKGIKSLKAAGTYLERNEEKYIGNFSDNEIEAAAADIITLIK
ncbi:hypothetical protein [Virgibacillus oceani]|uniref:ATPase n=1 Tax=Virgibacillus oceani TaxID=1479511 RepID=A0A917LZ85_9BACI|nr:hypothetical protein [Virgibacillus oceani]GGG67537.1 hypothetical protein GCM10011398_09150 [Virgibacillus oceani]